MAAGRAAREGREPRWRQRLLAACAVASVAALSVECRTTRSPESPPGPTPAPCALDGNPDRLIPPLRNPGEHFAAAKRAFDAGHWDRAAEMLRPIVRGQVSAGDEAVQEAQYLLAVAEARLGGGLPAPVSTVRKKQLASRDAAIEIMSAIVEQPHHRRRREAAEWLCERNGGQTVALGPEQRSAYATKVRGAPSRDETVRDEIRRRVKPLMERLKASPDDPALARAKRALKEALKRLKSGDLDAAEKAIAEHDAALAGAQEKALADAPDCSQKSCPLGGAARCFDTRARTARCVCDLEECDVLGDELMLCEADGDCRAGKGLMGACMLDMAESEGVRPPQKACVYKFVKGPGRAAMEAEMAAEAASACAGLACEADCRKLGGAACARLFGAAKPLFAGSDGPAGVARAARLFKVACGKGHAEACSAAGFAYGTGKGVARSVAESAKHYRRACELTQSEDDCGEAAAAECAARTLTPARRSPALDPYCNPRGGRPGAGPFRAYRPGDPTERIETDECFEAMRAVGCTGTNVASKGASAYCCR